MASYVDIYSISDQLKQKNLKTRLQDDLNQKQLFANIDKVPDLLGAGVYYIDRDLTVVELRKFQPICRINPVNIILKEPPLSLGSADFATNLKANRDSRLIGEISGTVMSCGAAVLSWVVVIGSAKAAPLTGGASIAVTYLAISAALASTGQCAKGIGRTYLEVTSPQTNDWLDSQEWFNTMSTTLDVISLGGAAVAGMTTIKMVLSLKSSTGKSITQLLKGLNRQERKRITEEAIRMKHPRISNTKLKAMVRKNMYPKRYSKLEINTSLQLQLKDAIAATLSFSGSASSGTVNQLAIGIFQSE